MLTTTQALAAAHTQSHGPSSLTSTVPSGRWVLPVLRRRQSRRTASKISCRGSSYAEGNGEVGVFTIDRPEPARVKQQETTVKMKAIVTVHLKSESKLDKASRRKDPNWGKLLTTDWLSIQLVSSELNPVTNQVMETAPCKATFLESRPDDRIYMFEATFDDVFCTVSAVRLDNDYEHEMFITEVKVFPDGNESSAISFYCNSWVIDNEQKGNDDRRTFFPLKSYLPSQTPKGVQQLRQSELEAIRGNGRGPRTKGDRIYDYDLYNDLGDNRPVLGGSDKYPYPRRCRTGRPKNKGKEERTKEPEDIYVPRDEAFSESKQNAFEAKKILSGLHANLRFLLHNNNSWTSLSAINRIYEDGYRNKPNKDEESKSELFWDLARKFFTLHWGQLFEYFKFETPEVYDADTLAWDRDEEFARETLGGMNPMSIRLVEKLPIVSQLDEEDYGPRESLLTEQLIEEQINGVMTAKEAVDNKKLFILDYHDALLPYVHDVRTLKDTTLYGSRTLFFLTKEGTLKPIAIELTRPSKPNGKQPWWRHVFTPHGSVSASKLWQLARTHVVAHDTGYHQLINHWLRTHCCVEPYIIAANRQLSQMHPIYRLLHPHFRYTMEINALARGMLINEGGIIESNFSLKDYCMEFSSKIYKDFWRFDMEALPNDLIRRGMAVEGKDGKLELTIEDYPYANDGLLIWDAIKEWISDYVNHYYSSNDDVINDQELQGWWKEVRTKGHEDKQHEPWWPKLDSGEARESLIQVLTTIIWITSGHHAAVNFGQYPYAGYIPNRPTIARQNIPLEMGDEAMKIYNKNPDKVLLDTFPSQFQSLNVIIVLDLLSSHSPDEQYMGTHVEPAWTADEKIKSAFYKFRGRLWDIVKKINKWNDDPTRKNRHGAGVVPYTLLRPCDGNPWDEKSVMEMGIPNSISI